MNKRSRGRIEPNLSGLSRAADLNSFALPLALVRIPAGFPSPADDYLEQDLDIGAYLVKRKGTTFFMRVLGDSMEDVGIHDGDLLVIDRAERVYDGAIVVARIADDFCVKRLRVIGGRLWLYPENGKYEPFEVTEGMDFEIWGRVTFSITPHCPAGSSRVSKIK